MFFKLCGNDLAFTTSTCEENQPTEKIYQLTLFGGLRHKKYIFKGPAHKQFEAALASDFLFLTKQW